jgi:uncharacterized membrane protein (UPF0182 family)
MEETTKPRPAATQPTKKTAKPVKRGRILRMKPGPLRNLIIVVIALVLVFGVGSVLSRIWTNYWWYAELAQTEVFWTPFLARLCVGLFFAVVFFGIFYGSLWLARKISPRLLPVKSTGENVLELKIRGRWPGRLLLLAAVVVAIIVGVAYSSRWEEILLFLHRTSFGYADPLFNKDASFFVFTLPVWKMLVNFVGVAILLTFVATALTYVADKALVLSERNRLSLAPHVKAHLSILLAIAMVAKAGDYMIQSWSLVYSSRGAVMGASYTDVHASLPVLHFLAIVSLVAAVIFLANIRYRGWRLPAIAIAVMFLTWALAGKAYPAIIQSYKVSPNEITAESPYIANNIEATRFAFGLDKVTSTSNPASSNLTAAVIKANEPTLDSVRLWEPRPALDTYQQIQEIRLYYAFTDIDVDRYMVDGKYRQVLISGRELDQTQLQPQSKSWVNLHLTYTHGYGVVMSPVNEASSDGLPVLWIKDIPPRTSTDLKITRPEIYYGELGNDYVVVKTTSPEFDYAQGDKNVTATYKGDGGVSIGSKLRQLAFAFRFRTAKLLFSSSLTAESRIMYLRTIRERVQALAPFLSYDKDPYLVLRDDGSLVWMWDAYTTSERFPYSQKHTKQFNYIRNPVKVVINAYDGSVTFYQVDATDPLATAWGKVFPGLFTPGDQMPADLRKHMRYPEDFFGVQADMLTTYHMTDPLLFYNKEDVWEIPTEIYENSTEPVKTVPYYEVLALPGESQTEFALVLPFTPLSKQNLSSLLVARQDGDNYGKLLTIDFPKDKLVFGPSQIEARISNEPEISSLLTLWDQAGSTVIHGNLLVVPVADSVMYFEPLYLQASQNSIPELTRVIVAYADRVVMEPTLSDALVKIFGSGAAIGSTTTVSGGTTTTGGTTSTTAPASSTTTTVPSSTTTTLGTGVPLPSDPAALIALANQLYSQALAAQQAGDWARYGQLIGELGKVLEALQAAQG